MMSELLGNVSYIDIVLLVLIVFSLIRVIMVQRNTKKKMVETEEKIVSLQKYQEEVSEGLDSKFASLKQDVDDTANKVTVRLNELLKKVNTTINESNKSVTLELENRTNPLKTSLNETRNTVRKLLMENEKEMKRMSKELEEFSKEIEKMKDDIRERTFDIEL